MAIQRIKGLAGIDFADIPVDGGMPLAAAFEPIGVTYRDEATLSEDDPTETEHYSNENDDPEESDMATGKKKLVFALIDWDPDNVVKYLQGTVTGVGDAKVWNAPLSKVKFEKAVRLRSKNGQYMIFPRISFYAKLDYKLAPSGIAKIVVSGTVLVPTLVDTPPLVVGKLA
jgi:hypothetical protein